MNESFQVSLRKKAYKKIINDNLFDSKLLEKILKMETTECHECLFNYYLNKKITSPEKETMINISELTKSIFKKLKIYNEIFEAYSDINIRQLYKKLTIPRKECFNTKINSVNYNKNVINLLSHTISEKKITKVNYKLLEYLNTPHVDNYQIKLINVITPNNFDLFLRNKYLFRNYNYSPLKKIELTRDFMKSKIVLHNFKSKLINTDYYTIEKHNPFDINDAIYQNEITELTKDVDIIIKDNTVFFHNIGYMKIPITKANRYLKFKFNFVTLYVISNKKQDYLFALYNKKFYSFKTTSHIIPTLLTDNFLTNLFSIIKNPNCKIKAIKTSKSTINITG